MACGVQISSSRCTCQRCEHQVNNGSAYCLRPLWVRNSNKIPIAPFKDQKADDGVVLDLGAVEKLDQDDRLRGSSPSLFAVHSYDD